MNHGRLFPTLIIAALSAAFFVVPATSFASHDDDPDTAPLRAEKRHFVKMYKVEKHLSLNSGEEGSDYYHDASTHVFCEPGDYAIDGMWRVDSVDQDEHGVQNLTDVNVYKSYADGVDHSKWHFEFYNNSEGQAQLKLFATCLAEKTAENGHQHEWELTASGHPFDQENNFVDPVGFHVDDPAWTGPIDSGNFCPSGSYAVAPGFSWTKGYGELLRSQPFDSDLDGWYWEFHVKLFDGFGDAQVYTSHKCLKSQSTTKKNHHHFLRSKWRTDNGFAGFLRFIGAESVETETKGCWQHSKAMLHSFNVYDFSNPSFGHRVWFLGMDPRPKKRSYKFQNKHNASQPVRIGVVCWNDRTSKKHAS